MRKPHAGAVGILAAAALTLPFAAFGSPLPAADGDDGSLSPGQLDAVEAGFQVAPKSQAPLRGDAAATDYSPAEGFTSLENTLNVTAWGYSGK